MVKNDGLDIKSASAGPGAIVYEQFGSLHLYDLKSGQDQTRSRCTSRATLPKLRPHFVKVSQAHSECAYFADRARAVFEARGEILTVPAEKGDMRNLTNTPAWRSAIPPGRPMARRIAYFSDESGEYALHLRAQNGMGEVTEDQSGQSARFYYYAALVARQQEDRLHRQPPDLWYVDLDKKRR